MYDIKVVHVRDGVDGTVYIGRAGYGRKASPLANPFRIGRDGSREAVIAKYRRWLWNALNSPTGPITRQWHELSRLCDILLANKGLALECYCAPQACHGDVIASAIEWMLSK